MNPAKKTVLQRNIEKLVEDLDVDDIIPKLYSQLVINPDDIDKINAQSQRKIRTRCFLDLISQKNDEEYDKFVNVLHDDYDWLANNLKRDTDIGCVNEEEYQEQVYSDALTLGEVPQLPMHYVPRTSELHDIKRELRNLHRGRYVVLHGMTGSGKSVLAISAVRDKRLLTDNFHNSMYFVNAGEAKQDMDIASVLYRLYIKLDNNYKQHSTTDIEFNKTGILYMQNKLRNFFSSDDKSQALLILDDVCTKSFIDAFNFGCKTLVTTRDLTVVPQESSSLFDVNKGFKEIESLKLFSQSVGLKMEELPSETRRIHVLCKGAPFVISLIASNAAKWKMEARKKERWNEYINMLIDKKDGRFEKVLQKFSRRKKDEPPKDHTYNTIKHCLSDLSTTYQQFYRYFALFVEDVNITPRVLEVVLQKSKYEVEELVSELQNKSLLVCAYNSELKTYVYGIHDLLLSYLKQILSEEELVKYHTELVNNYLKKSDNDFAKLPNDNYIFTYIGYHLVEAQQYDVFPHLYFNLNFIGAKIKAVGIAGLVGDFVRYRKHITKDENPELSQKLKTFQNFVQNYGQDLFKFPYTDIIQCALQQPEDSAVYEAAINIAYKQCSHTLYLQTKFFGQTRYVTNTLDLNEDVSASCFAYQTNTILVGTSNGEIHLWDHSFKSKLRTFTGHKKRIVRLELFEDGTNFISVSEDGVVKIWSLEDGYTRRSGIVYDETGLQLNTPPPSIYQKNWMSFFGDDERADHSKTYSVPDDNITCASLSSQHIVYGTENGKVQVVNLKNDEVVFNTSCSNVSITCCILSLEDFLVLFAYENVILIYDFRTQEYVSQFMNDVRTTSLLVVPYAKTKIIAISDHSVTLWSWVQYQHKQLILISDIQKFVLDSRNDASYICGAVTGDGAYLVAGLSDHYIRMWNIATTETVTEMFEHNGLVISLDTYTDEGSSSNIMYILLSGSDNKTVKQWHMVDIESSNKKTTKLLPQFTTHWPLNNLIPLIAAINSDNQIQVFNGHALISESRVLNHPKCLTFSPCGNSVAIGLDDGVVMLFDVRNKKSTNVMNLEGYVTYIEYLSNKSAKSGYILIAASDNSCLMAYNGEESFRYKKPEIKDIKRSKVNDVMKNTNSKTIKCFSLLKIDRILSVEENGSVKLWNTQNLVDVLVVSDAHATVVMADISDKHDLIVLTYHTKEFGVYSLTIDDFKVECLFKHRSMLEDIPRCCTFSPCGHLLALGLDSGVIVIWSVENNRKLTTLHVHTTWVRNLIFSQKPIEGAPLILVSIGDQIAWWDMTYVWLTSVKNIRKNSRNRALLRFSNPLDLLIDEIPSRVLMDDSWIGKKGPDGKRELLSVIKLSGGNGLHVACSPKFTCFVTVDSSGILYIMHILQPKPEVL